jgi:hypothetical protein
MTNSKYELTPSEKLTLVSCLNSRRDEYLDESEFKELYNFSYADWAEKMRGVSKRIRYIDTVHRLLMRFEGKRNYLIFEEIIDRIRKVKACKEYLLIGQEDDYYKLTVIDNEHRTSTFSLKDEVRVSGEFAFEWINRGKLWVENEAKKPLVKKVNKKEALRLIKSCKYRNANAPSEEMMRFLKVILR